MRIENITALDPITEQERVVTIDIEEGRVKKVYTTKPSGACQGRVIDGRGLILTPGLTDAHVHFRDPGFTYKEDIDSGAKVAARGGFTDIILMANTKPTVDNEETLKYVIDKCKKQKINIRTCASVSHGLKGQDLVDMEALKAKGAVGFTDDGIPIMEEETLAAALRESERLNVIISLHEEDKSYISENGINAGLAAAHYGIKGSPREAEYKLIERDINILRKTGGNMLVQHISSKEGVDLVRKAQAEGLHIYAEATPHHIALTEEAVIKYGTNAKMNPPLRTEADRQAILEGIKDDTINIISTDHAPHAPEEKEVEITKAPSGILGLETSFPVCYEALVLSGKISFSHLIRKMSLEPRRLYGIELPEAKEGSPANFTIFDLDEKWTYASTLSKSKNSPFFGREFTGKVKYTIANGEIAYEDL